MARANKIGFMGKVTIWYLRGLHGAAGIRERIYKAVSYKEIISLIDGVK